MKYELLKVGTDAEVFLRTRYEGKPIPVIGKLGGTKQAPLPVKELGDGFAVQEDNVMAEFNVPPASDAKIFSDNIHKMLAHLKHQMFINADATLAIQGSMRFTEEQLRHPQAQTFGCDPDYCAWTDSVNDVELWQPILQTMRTAAAHIHVSYNIDGEAPKTYVDRCVAVRAHDLFLGVPSILLDTDRDRRKIYGKAGAFRVTDYGHEYRTPSNFWIVTPELREWTFNQTKEAIDFLNTRDAYKILMNDSFVAESIQYAINNHHIPTVEFLCHEFSLNLPNNV